MARTKETDPHRGRKDTRLLCAGCFNLLSFQVTRDFLKYSACATKKLMFKKWAQEFISTNWCRRSAAEKHAHGRCRRSIKQIAKCVMKTKRMRNVLRQAKIMYAEPVEDSRDHEDRPADQNDEQTMNDGHSNDDQYLEIQLHYWQGHYCLDLADFEKWLSWTMPVQEDASNITNAFSGLSLEQQEMTANAGACHSPRISYFPPLDLFSPPTDMSP